MAILLLLGVATGRHATLMQLIDEDQAFTGEAVGEKLLQLWSKSSQWDSSILGVVDSESYTDDVRDALAENTSSDWTSGAVPEDL